MALRRRLIAHTTDTGLVPRLGANREFCNKQNVQLHLFFLRLESNFKFIRTNEFIHSECMSVKALQHRSPPNSLLNSNIRLIFCRCCLCNAAAVLCLQARSLLLKAAATTVKEGGGNAVRRGWSYSSRTVAVSRRVTPCG